MPQRIAVFDTSPALLKLFESLLAAHGYEVVCVPAELTGAAELAPWAIDLLILGYLRGYLNDEVFILRDLRANSATHRLPVLIATTGDPTSLEIRVREITDRVWVLGKPFDASQLIAVVRRAIG
jgi:DNA-binding response OmpR family regulator